MNEKAVASNYATKTGYQAHAEVEFIEFLLRRNKQNPEQYTHIWGTGCSRQHGRKCDCPLQLHLGANYHNFTAVMYMKGDLVPPNITNREEKDGLRMQTEARYTVVHQREAVSSGDKRSNRYYLPEVLKNHIRLKTNCHSFDFSAERFEIKEKVVRRIGKKRKIDKKATQWRRRNMKNLYV